MLPSLSIFRSSTARLSLSAALIAFSPAAWADVTISSAATQNITCSGGVCTPTATSAVLNNGDLETLLASGNVEVTTTGSGVQASNIVVGDGVSWSAATGLTLDAYQSVSIDKGIAVQGQAGLTLTTNDGGTNGTLVFGHKGSVSFANLSSSLTINGTAYTLVNTIQSLAAAIAANPSGAYALASNYDASQDGTYTTVPVPTPLTGTFEGLGNAVSKLSINDTADTYVGLFSEVGSGGTLRDLLVLKASIASNNACSAPVVGISYGNVLNAYASGTVNSSGSSAGGGLLGCEEFASTSLSGANTNISAATAGGLIGNALGGSIDQSFATGKALGSVYIGALIGINGTSITNCYATGAVGTSEVASDRGGLIGQNYEGNVEDSYSASHIIGGVRAQYSGGFVGYTSLGTYGNDYWDVNKNGFRSTHKGAGNVKNILGIEGLKTVQLQSGLPQGFNPSIWGESKEIEGGLPYLLSNSPR